MKVILLVQRDPDEDAYWVLDAIDEYSMEDWGNDLPPQMRKHEQDDPEDVRRLAVEIPDDALKKAFEVPTVQGRIT